MVKYLNAVIYYLDPSCKIPDRNINLYIDGEIDLKTDNVGKFLSKLKLLSTEMKEMLS